jgi:long-chain acyl-CoA synthetase
VPDFESVRRWAAQEGVDVKTDAQIVASPRVRELIEREVDKHSDGFKGFERVKRVALVEEDFTAQNGLLTPTLKLKRRVAIERYKDRIEALYAEAAKKEKAAAAAAE